MRNSIHKNVKGKLCAKYYNSMRLLKTRILAIDNNRDRTATIRQFDNY